MPLDRRGLLRTGAGAAALGIAGLGGACAPPAGGGPVVEAQVYVGLARERAVAIIDAASDRIVRKISLTSLGERGLPAQMGISPGGTAAVLPLSSVGPNLGLVTPTPVPGASGGGAQQAAEHAERGSGRRRFFSGAAGALGSQAERDKGRCSWIGLGPEQSPGASRWSGQVAKNVIADQRGRAYVLLGDRLARAASSAAVVALDTGEVLSHVPVAGAGEMVMALAVHPDGDVLYASIWTPLASYGGRPVPAGMRWSSEGAGRVVAIDTRTGRVVALAGMPSDAVATELVLSRPPRSAATSGATAAAEPASGQPGRRGANAPGQLALYAVTRSPGPGYEDESRAGVEYRSALTALDADTLDPLDIWSLPGPVAATALAPDGSRAYMLMGGMFSGPWSRELICLDLNTGTPAAQWPMPFACFSLALSPVGKLYIADGFNDRVWRIDTRTNTLLGSLSMPGAPITVAARPV